jgi:cell wall-associated NlpC family hydrolase
MKLGWLLSGLVVLGLVCVLGVAAFLGGSAGVPAAAVGLDSNIGAVCSSGTDMAYRDGFGTEHKLDSPQLAIVASIVRVGKELKTPQRGVVIAIATSLQESTLHNWANSSVPASVTYPNDGIGHDHDSVGPFQQRPSQGWGTVEQLMKPDYQARQFLTRLVRVPNWQTIPETDAAQIVQTSAFGSLYQQWVNSARQILGAAEGISCSDFTAGPGGRPSVVQAALHYVGTPYAWAGGNLSGPSRGVCISGAPANDCNVVGFDCSGLVLYAYGKLGISLPHLASSQYSSGPHIARKDLQPGDLVFLASDRSEPGSIHHVAMWIGNNAIVQAPESGQAISVVKNPFSQGWFAGEYIGATRPLIPGGAR